MTRPLAPIIRPAAEKDIDAAIDHYLAEAGVDIAQDFYESLRQAVDHLSRNPQAGSPRYSHQMGIPGLLYWPLKRFPYLIFYVIRGDALHVARVLHGSRDIPGSMQGNVD